MGTRGVSGAWRNELSCLLFIIVVCIVMLFGSSFDQSLRARTKRSQATISACNEPCCPKTSALDRRSLFAFPPHRHKYVRSRGVRQHGNGARARLQVCVPRSWLSVTAADAAQILRRADRSLIDQLLHWKGCDAHVHYSRIWHSEAGRCGCNPESIDFHCNLCRARLRSTWSSSSSTL